MLFGLGDGSGGFNGCVRMCHTERAFSNFSVDFGRYCGLLLGADPKALSKFFRELLPKKAVPGAARVP